MSIKEAYTQFFVKGVSVREKFFKHIFLFGTLIGLAGTIACINLNSSPTAIQISASMTVVFPFFALLGGFAKKKKDTIISIALAFINFIIFPAMYLTGGDVNSGIPGFFVLGIALTFFLVKGKLGIILGIAECVWVFSIYTLSYFFPWITFDIPAEATAAGARDFTYNAIFSNVAMVFVGLGILCRMLFRLYYKQSKTVDSAIKEVKRQAIIDPLTDMYNRRYMYTYLSEQVKSCRENEKPLSVILFDIDHFKNLNDTYGHLLGDDVLKAVSAIIKGSCVNDEIVARYGGEEFLIILPDTTIEKAIIRGNEIRERIENTHLAENLPTDKPVTISGGVSTLVEGLNEETLVSAADEELYRAKDSGRNRICASCEEGGTADV